MRAWLIVLLGLSVVVAGCETKKVPEEAQTLRKKEKDIEERFFSSLPLPPAKPPEPKPKQPTSTGKTPIAELMDDLGFEVKTKENPNWQVLKEKLAKLEPKIRKFYQDDITRNAALRDVADPWMKAFEAFKAAILAEDKKKAEAAMNRMIATWQQWNISRRMGGR